MKVINKFQLLALGLFMACTAIASPDALNTDAKFENLESVCPDCEMVAKMYLTFGLKTASSKTPPVQ
ncbi:hypothetical protein PCI56_05520 [Plesiomonas shigelloides subsp. oncorhynchi]|nr:hypothetical protein [Plesiomonas shigelloides]MDA1379408.1 hypothetical protein [Plesiomonas shigelloides]